MNILYNATNKNGFYNKLTAVSALLVSLIYISPVTLIPIISGIINTKNNAYVSATKQYNALSNKGLTTKTNSAAFNTINTATYINNGQMLTRQIDNANLQSYIPDAKGSVLKLNSADKSQNQTYSYDAYGKPIANATKANSVLNVLNPFQYNGERFDNNTNLQYLRARFYNPETKRFVNQDSYELLNRFNYVDGNPVMGADPSGHITSDEVKTYLSDNWKMLAIIGGSIVGAAVLSVGPAFIYRRYKNRPSPVISTENGDQTPISFINVPRGGNNTDKVCAVGTQAYYCSQGPGSFVPGFWFPSQCSNKNAMCKIQPHPDAKTQLALENYIKNTAGRAVMEQLITDGKILTKNHPTLSFIEKAMGRMYIAWLRIKGAEGLPTSRFNLFSSSRLVKEAEYYISNFVNKVGGNIDHIKTAFSLGIGDNIFSQRLKEIYSTFPLATKSLTLDTTYSYAGSEHDEYKAINSWLLNQGVTFSQLILESAKDYFN